MKIALVTNTKLHHKFWASQLYLSNNVNLILHPKGVKAARFKKIKQKKLFYYGGFYFLLKVLSLVYWKIFNNGLSKRNKLAEKRFFLQYENKTLFLKNFYKKNNNLIKLEYRIKKN